MGPVKRFIGQFRGTRAVLRSRQVQSKLCTDPRPGAVWVGPDPKGLWFRFWSSTEPAHKRFQGWIQVSVNPGLSPLCDRYAHSLGEAPEGGLHRGLREDHFKALEVVFFSWAPPGLYFCHFKMYEMVLKCRRHAVLATTLFLHTTGRLGDLDLWPRPLPAQCVPLSGPCRPESKQGKVECSSVAMLT